MNLSQVVLLVVQLGALLLAVVCHEVAHGWVAYRLGDPTAKRLKRLSLNPLRHIDPIGTVALPAVLAMLGAPVFGFAKPVPVNPGFFRNPFRGMMQVALAGPLVNFALAAACYALLGGLASTRPTLLSQVFDSETLVTPTEFVVFFLVVFFIVNLILGSFNLIPVPPLDGSRALAYVLPLRGRKLMVRLERFGLLIVLGLMLIGVLPRLLEPIYDGAVWLLMRLLATG